MGITDWIEKFFENHTTTVIIGSLTGVFSWFFTKRHIEEKNLKQADANIDSTMVEVVSKNLSLYQRMIDDIDEKYQASLLSYKQEIESLKEKLQKVLEELKECQEIK